jgi:hypothetical protein
MGLFGKRKQPRVSLLEAYGDVVTSGMALSPPADELFGELATEIPDGQRDMAGLSYLVATGLAADLACQGFGPDGLILASINDGRDFEDRLASPPPHGLMRLTRRLRNLFFTAAASACSVPDADQASWLRQIGVGEVVASQLLGPPPLRKADGLVQYMWLLAGLSTEDRAVTVSGDVFALADDPDVPWQDGLIECLGNYLAQASAAEMLAVGLATAESEMVAYDELLTG